MEAFQHSEEYAVLRLKMADLYEHYKNICSSETIYSHKKGFYREFSEVSKQSIGLNYLENILSSIELHEECLLNIFYDEHISITLFSMLNKISKLYKKKDALHSKKIRIECFNKQHHINKITNCLTKLNKAVIYAPEIVSFLTLYIFWDSKTTPCQSQNNAALAAWIFTAVLRL
ncbi:hypothetical protein TSAR_004421 [Trichomalopsis sarcophagae]|uniref:Uncharacterized protein n=1 Tax=Trichomalopsis sarcophagae TaxID=543379 RepID=A0A232FA91_9HYME|nr:hypothetical protein TSAR_004421 [Trichomalopsis sarcophagae]